MKVSSRNSIISMVFRELLLPVLQSVKARDIQSTSFISMKILLPSISFHLVADSSRTNMIKLRVPSIREEKTLFCNVLSTLKGKQILFHEKS